MRILIAALLLTATLAHADGLMSTGQVGYTAERYKGDGVDLMVCPKPNTTPTLGACITPEGEDGWINPYYTSPVKGYWVRLAVFQVRKKVGPTVVLFLCNDGSPCQGD